MTIRYFDKPTQVMFNDPESGEWDAGIAYRDEIICGCCGGIFEISEVIENANARNIECAIYSYYSWTDLECEIIGGELPEGLGLNDNDEVYELSTEEKEYEQSYFLLEEEEESQAEESFANVWAMPPSVD